VLLRTAVEDSRRLKLKTQEIPFLSTTFLTLVRTPTGAKKTKRMKILKKRTSSRHMILAPVSVKTRIKRTASSTV
jgi:hypothetical protein